MSTSTFNLLCQNLTAHTFSLIRLVSNLTQHGAHDSNVPTKGTSYEPSSEHLRKGTTETEASRRDSSPRETYDQDWFTTNAI